LKLLGRKATPEESEEERGRSKDTPAAVSSTERESERE
jgi:hypothetical protein